MEGHSELIPDPEEQEAPLCAVDGGLPDELVKALGVQLSTSLNHGDIIHSPVPFSYKARCRFIKSAVIFKKPGTAFMNFL